MKHFYVYVWHDPAGSAFYVGKGTGKRAWDLRNGRSKALLGYIYHLHEQHIHYQVRVYSVENEERAFELERYLIKFYGRKDSGIGSLLNFTDGGEGTSGIAFTEEHKRKIGESNHKVNIGKKKPPRTLEHIKNNMISMTQARWYSHMTKQQLTIVNNLQATYDEYHIKQKLPYCKIAERFGFSKHYFSRRFSELGLKCHSKWINGKYTVA